MYFFLFWMGHHVIWNELWDLRIRSIAPLEKSLPQNFVKKWVVKCEQNVDDFVSAQLYWKFFIWKFGTFHWNVIESSPRWLKWPMSWQQNASTHYYIQSDVDWMANICLRRLQCEKWDLFLFLKANVIYVSPKQISPSKYFMRPHAMYL